MRTMLLYSDGEISRRDNTVMFDSGEQKRYLPIHEVDEIMVFGEVSMNKRFLEFCSKREILLHFFNYHGYYVGSFYPREHLSSGHMLLKQVEHYTDGNKRLYLAKGFVRGAIKNILQVLRYYQYRDRPVSKSLEHIEAIGEGVDQACSIESLMAIEGNVRSYYYAAFDEVIRNPDFVFERRTKQPPRNYLNTLISLGNSIVYTIVLSEIYKTHLDPRIGYLHATNLRRFTLNLDVAEIFKPVIVDRAIFAVVNERKIQGKDFAENSGGVFLKDAGRRVFVNEIMQKLETTARHRGVGRVVSYRRLIRMELYKVEKHLLGEKEYQPFIVGW
jgi:CRISPR-associated protein Cas1